MIKYSLTFLLFFVIASSTGFCQRLLPGYTILKSDLDTVFGEYKRPQSPTQEHKKASYEKLFLAGQQFEYVQIGNSQQLLQRLSGESIRLYRSLDLSNPTFYLKDDKGLSVLTEERINLELGQLFSSCSSLSNAMAYTKVKYKAEPLIELINQYTECMGLTNPKWSRSDSLEFNLSFDFFGGGSTVQDQPFKDHSGEFTDINYQGWGLTATAFSGRRIRLMTGIKVYDMSTTNPMANVTPFSDLAFSSQVEYRWSNYEIPLAAAYNFQMGDWRAFVGISGSVIITDNLTVSELFSAPFLSRPEKVLSQLLVNDHFGIGGMIGIERKLGSRWMLGLQYELQRTEMDFNLVRINRNPEQRSPIITTYRVSSPSLFASATDLTKFRFTTSRLGISLKFRAFRSYNTFN